MVGRLMFKDVNHVASLNKSRPGLPHKTLAEPDLCPLSVVGKSLQSISKAIFGPLIVGSK